MTNILTDTLKIAFSLVFDLGFLVGWLVCLFSPSNMRHALGKMVCAKMGQKRTLIDPPKWNNSLPTLLQLWHLDHVILLGFYIYFFSLGSFY